MCIDYKWSRKDRKEWLEKQPDMITAWKEVMFSFAKGPRCITPRYQTGTNFKRENYLKEEPSSSYQKNAPTRYEKSRRRTEYKAYFHLFKYKKDADREAKGYYLAKVIKCKIPKEYVTDIGEQWDSMTIITRKFIIVGQDEYLRD